MLRLGGVRQNRGKAIVEPHALGRTFYCSDMDVPGRQIIGKYDFVNHPELAHALHGRRGETRRLIIRSLYMLKAETDEAEICPRVRARGVAPAVAMG